MFRFRLLAPCLCAALVCIAPSDSVQEAVVVVTPTDLQGWAPANVRKMMVSHVDLYPTFLEAGQVGEEPAGARRLGRSVFGI